jgi:hypothetical protein
MLLEAFNSVGAQSRNLVSPFTLQAWKFDSNTSGPTYTACIQVESMVFGKFVTRLAERSLSGVIAIFRCECKNSGSNTRAHSYHDLKS